MKKLSFDRLVMVMLMVLASVSFVSCSDDDDDEIIIPKTNTIVDIAVANPDFSLLVAALTRAELVSVLADPKGDFTVFAPTNAAFNALLAELKVATINDIPKETLTAVLLYHVRAGKATSSQINTGYYSSVSPGPETGSFLSFYVDKASTTINNRSKITAVDVMADNGVIHVIDQVMLPLSIVGHAQANPAFSSLVAAVVKANLVDALNAPKVKYTVFAPINAAFDKLFTNLGVTLNDLSAETLTPILTYHVVDAYVPSTNVPNGYVPTLSQAFDNSISVKSEVNTSGVFLNKTAQVVVADVVATNGVIHAINEVILPPTVVDIAIQNDAFSILVEAVAKAGLVDALKGDGPFTVFAPTNDAFNALFASLEGVTGIADLTKEQLTPILLAHVVSGNVLSSALSTGEVPTLNENKKLNITVSGQSVTIDGNINVVLANVQGKNGVVHVINKVILP